MIPFLFIVSFILHNLEEAIWLPAWSRSTKRFHKPVENHVFYFSVSIVTIIGVSVVIAYLLNPKESLQLLAFCGLLGSMMFNTFSPHLIATIATRTYCPGPATGLAFILPVSIAGITKLIRAAKKEDLKDLLLLYQQLFPEEDYRNTQAYIRTWAEILTDKKIKCFIAHKESTAVASFLITIIPNLTRNQRPYAVIENVVTDKNYRRQGYGKSVMKKAVEYAEAQNCYKIMLMSSSARKESHKFYEKIGFDGNSKKGFQLRIL